MSEKNTTSLNSESDNTERAPKLLGPQKVNIEEFLAIPIRGVPQTKPFMVNGHWISALDRSGHWEGNNWVTSKHTYSKTDDGQWVDEDGKYIATAIPGDARPRRAQPTAEERRRRGQMVQTLEKMTMNEPSNRFSRK